MNATPVRTAELLIERGGTAITLPLGMTIESAIEALQRKKREGETAMDIYQVIQGCAPLDGFVCFYRALAERYGWISAVPTPSMFGDKPPTFVGVDISATESIQIPFGRIALPGLEGGGYVTASIVTEPEPMFVIGGRILQKDKDNVDAIVPLTRKLIREQSIYRSKAITIDFDYARDERDYDVNADQPHFMQLDASLESSVVFAEDVQRALSAGLFTPIEHAEACRRHQVPLKRGVLLHGTYGVGKTITANVTATKATRNGWTFIYLKDVRDLAEGIKFALNYTPAVLFAEDIDRAVSGPRSAELDEILNSLDGIDTKGKELITVFTTNHIEQINTAVLRPGRMDTVIEVLPPDARAAKALVTLYARDLLAKSVSLDAVTEKLAGKIPAFIREVVERAKIAAIARLGGSDITGQVSDIDLMSALRAMEAHGALLAPKKTINPFDGLNVTGAVLHSDSLPKHQQNGSSFAAAV